MANELSIEQQEKLSAGLYPVLKCMPASSEFKDKMVFCIGWASNATEASSLMLGVVEPVTEIPGIGKLPFSGAGTFPVRVQNDDGKFRDKEGRYDLIQFFTPQYQYLGKENN